MREGKWNWMSGNVADGGGVANGGLKGSFGQLLRGEGQSSEGEGKGLGLIRPSIAPTSFF